MIQRERPNFRWVMDLLKGAIMLGFGIFIMFTDSFPDRVLLQGSMRWVMGGILVLLGLYRTYSGIIAFKKKNDE